MGAGYRHEVRQVSARPAPRNDDGRHWEIPAAIRSHVPGPEDDRGVRHPARHPDRPHDGGNTFREIREATGLADGPTDPAARLHDFRHSFATNTLIGHIRAGGDADAMMRGAVGLARACRPGSDRLVSGRTRRNSLLLSPKASTRTRGDDE